MSNLRLMKLVRTFGKLVQDGYGDVLVEPPPLDFPTVLSKPKSAAGQSSMVNIISERSYRNMSNLRLMKLQHYCANFRKIGAGWVW
jgi:hypothetical protein